MTEPVIRLFISSPADVSAERRRAALIVDRLNGEFAGRVRIEPVLWEKDVYSAHTGFQDQIAEAASCDVVIAIFGGRLGTRLPDSFPRHPRTGDPYPSGTAYEVLSAIEARRDGHDLPDIYVFRFPQAPVRAVDSPDQAEARAQWQALQSFFETWFKGEGGTFVTAFNTYTNSDEFAAQAEQCLRAFLAQGDLPEALESYRTSQSVRVRLTKADPENVAWQSDLSDSYSKIGWVLLGQGNLPEALRSFQSGFAIADHLAKSDPENTDWQHDLAMTFAGIGYVLGDERHSAEARDAFMSGRAVMLHLLQRFPDRPGWKQDLADFDSNLAALNRPADGSTRRK